MELAETRATPACNCAPRELAARRPNLKQSDPIALSSASCEARSARSAVDTRLKSTAVASRQCCCEPATRWTKAELLAAQSGWTRRAHLHQLHLLGAP